MPDGLGGSVQVSSFLSLKTDEGRWGGQWSREELRGIPQQRLLGTTQFPILVPPAQRVWVLVLKAACMGGLVCPGMPLGSLGFLC